MRTARLISRLFGGDPRFVGLDRRSVETAHRLGRQNVGLAPANAANNPPGPQ
jgi:hypothetical protein